MIYEEPKSPDDPVFVMCNRVSSGMTWFEGSTKETCEQCMEQVWISPATLATKVEHSGHILCEVCAAPKIAEAHRKNDLDFMVAPRQLEEIKRKFAPDQPKEEP